MYSPNSTPTLSNHTIRAVFTILLTFHLSNRQHDPYLGCAQQRLLVKRVDKLDKLTDQTVGYVEIESLDKNLCYVNTLLAKTTTIPNLVVRV